jgi:hypothetical protein
MHLESVWPIMAYPTNSRLFKKYSEK